MRDLKVEELGHVYGAGGTGRSSALSGSRDGSRSRSRKRDRTRTRDRTRS
jgi:hypothetical protein